MIKLEKAVKKEQLDNIYELYISSFPKIERKPFELMLDKLRLFCHTSRLQMYWNRCESV